MFRQYSEGDGYTWTPTEKTMPGTNFHFWVESFVWNKDCQGEPGGTETKQKAGAVARVRKNLVVMGNDGEKQLGSREV